MVHIGLLPTNVDLLTNKSWLLADQKAAFAACQFAASTVSIANVFDPLVRPLALSQADLAQGVEFEGDDITVSLLNQALEYFQKALYNFNSHYLLAQNGYSTWAGVTNYYSSYFSIFSLLSLQGRAITRIDVDGGPPRPLVIHPSDFRQHRYVLTSKDTRDSSHRMPWNKYYNIYDNYASLRPEFDIVQFKRFVGDPYDESDQRNKINYKIFEGFQEIISISDLTAFKTHYLSSIASPDLTDTYDSYLTALYSLATDPDLMYFARSALRLILIRCLFAEIGSVNVNFEAAVTARIPTWQNTMFDIYHPPTNYYEDFVNKFIQQ